MAEHSSDPSRFKESATQTSKELYYRARLEQFIANSGGSYVEKFENFAKYVPRQKLTHFLAKLEIFKRVLQVQGSIVECGVLLGGGLMSWAQFSAILEPVNHQRQIIWV